MVNYAESNKLWKTLGSIETGVNNLKVGQQDLKQEVIGIKMDCAATTRAFSDRLGKVEDKPAQRPSSPDVDIDISRGKVAIKDVNWGKVQTVAVRSLVVYLFLRALGLVPENMVEHIQEKVNGCVVMAEIEEESGTL